MATGYLHTVREYSKSEQGSRLGFLTRAVQLNLVRSQQDFENFFQPSNFKIRRLRLIKRLLTPR